MEGNFSTDWVGEDGSGGNASDGGDGQAVKRAMGSDKERQMKRH